MFKSVVAIAIAVGLSGCAYSVTPTGALYMNQQVYQPAYPGFGVGDGPYQAPILGPVIAPPTPVMLSVYARASAHAQAPWVEPHQRPYTAPRYVQVPHYGQTLQPGQTQRNTR